ncbi:MAG: metallophosphoesterase [Parcubacteria group bacterium]|nr:metallophosphoesterase [Parcubacteria group bacterium]
MGKIKIILILLVIIFFTKNAKAAFDFAVYGDSRTGHSFHQEVVNQIITKDPDFVLHTGDIVASGGSVADWNMFQSIASPLLSKTPPSGLTRSFFPTIGNHDLPIANYFSVFSMSDYYYSFEYEDFHFISLNSEQSYTVGSTQYNWLLSDLRGVQNKNIIVSIHRPAYSSGAHGSTTEIINNLVPLFEQYRVRFVFSGHDHIYERSYPVYQDAINNVDGVTYIIAGAGGAPLYDITPGNWWTAESESTYHFVYFQITPTSFIGQTIDRNGNIIDSFEVASTDIENHTISINSDASITESRDVILSFTASRAPYQMMISEDEDFTDSSWEAYSSIKDFQLSDDDEEKTVYVKFRDEQYGETTSVSDSIILDLPPIISSKILTTSGPGEPTRLQAYSKGNTDSSNSLLNEDITNLFPSSYTGGAGIVPIDQNNNEVLDQFLIFTRENGGPQARVMGLREDGSTVLKGQQFVFQNPEDESGTSSIRDGLSATVGDFDNDGFQDDAAFCLTGDYNPRVKVFKDVTGIDNWELINQFDADSGVKTGCNLGTFQYDDGAEELLVTSNHGPAEPKVWIYTVSGTLKKDFWAYDAPINQGITAVGTEDRIYTTPNNGSSQVNAYDRAGSRKNFWWVYEEHVRGDFTIRSAQLDPSDEKQELLISPIGSNGPHILGYRTSGIQKATPNFFAFDDETLRNGVGIAVIENWHGVN